MQRHVNLVDLVKSFPTKWKFSSDLPGFSGRAQHAAAHAAAHAGVRATHPIAPLLPAVLKEVLASLGGRKRRGGAPPCAEAALCVARLAEALGTDLEPHCDELLPGPFRLVGGAPHLCWSTAPLARLEAPMAQAAPAQLGAPPPQLGSSARLASR